jgi:hypothetical protein
LREHSDPGFFEQLIEDGRPALLLTAAALAVSGAFAIFLSLRREFLPHDVSYLGMTAHEVCALADCRVVRFMFHDRVAFGGSLISIAVLYAWIAAGPLREREKWAWWTFIASGVVGFGSFLAYLGYGYLDAWHAAATLALLPVFIVGLVRASHLAEMPSSGWLRTPDGRVANALTRAGRWGLLATGAGTLAAGTVILFLGTTEVFVAEDLAFMGLTRDSLNAVNPRLVPLIAHDRAGFGGGLATTGLVLLLCAWYARPGRAFHQALLVAGTAGFGCAIGVHFFEGYTNPVHLAPAFAGAILFVISGLCETIGYRSALKAKRVISVSTVLLMLLACATAVSAQTPTVREEPNIHGRPGWVLENGKIRVGLLRAGGHIAEVRLVSANPRLSINPMFIPAVGDGYMGHLVCFPYYGPASADERAQGLRGHGEAGSVEWQQTRPPRIDAQGVTFFYGADLPKTQYKIERAVTLHAGETALHVEEWIENLAPYDRPYNRNQHATFGAPFVTPGRNILDMSGTRGITDPVRTAGGKWSEGQLFQWPVAPRGDGIELSLRDFLAIPGGQAYTPVLTDRAKPQSWFALYNADYPLLVGYVFPSDDHPWIIDWQNQPRNDVATGTARGIEFGTSPFDEGLRKSVERGQLLGAPTYRFIGAGQRLSTTFTMFLREIPLGFNGVADVHVEGGQVIVIQR